MYDFHFFFHSGSDIIPLTYVNEFSFVQNGILATFFNYGKLKVIISFHKERWMSYRYIDNRDNEITKIQNFLAEFQLKEEKKEFSSVLDEKIRQERREILQTLYQQEE